MQFCLCKVQLESDVKLNQTDLLIAEECFCFPVLALAIWKSARYSFVQSKASVFKQ